MPCLITLPCAPSSSFMPCHAHSYQKTITITPPLDHPSRGGATPTKRHWWSGPGAGAAQYHYKAPNPLPIPPQQLPWCNLIFSLPMSPVSPTTPTTMCSIGDKEAFHAKYKFIDCIGSGGQGGVFRFQNRHTGEIVVVKEYGVLSCR